MYRNRVSRWGGLMASGAFMILTGCDTRHSKFIEPVTLSDGRTITIKREQTFGRAGDIAEPSWLRARSTLIVLEDDFVQRRWEDYGVQPMLLDVESGSLVLIGLVENEHPKRTRPTPQPPYFQYRLLPEGWVAEPVSDVFWHRPPNLVADAGDGGWFTHTVSAGEKSQRLTIGPAAPRQYRTIDPKASVYDSH
jgi:hypothetical protein